MCTRFFPIFVLSGERAIFADMADNYLEKREQELRERRPAGKVVRNNPSLETLLKRNRSYRGYDRAREVTVEELGEMVRTVTWCSSGMNAQPLRFRLLTGAQADIIHPLVKLGAQLPDEHLPHEGEEPSAYIVCCSSAKGRAVDIDLGIAAQSILLKSTQMGLGGIFILNFDPAKVRAALDLPIDPLAIIAIGKPKETIFLLPVHEGDSLNYYRKDGVHFVPKLQLEDLLI